MPPLMKSSSVPAPEKSWYGAVGAVMMCVCLLI